MLMRSSLPAFPFVLPRAQRPIEVGPSWSAEKEKYSVSHVIPGVSSEQVIVEVQEDLLSLRIVEPSNGSEQNPRVLQRYVWRVPEDSMMDNIAANLARGVLTITVPRRQAPPARRIDVVEQK